MEWYWGLLVIFFCCCMLLLLRYCKERCNEPDYRRSVPYNNSSTTPAPPGFSVENQRVPLRPQGILRVREPHNNSSLTPAAPGFIVENSRAPLRSHDIPGSIPMPTAGFANRGNSHSLDHISRNNPYPPVITATAPYPLTPIRRQLSSSAEDLPPSYDDTMQQQTRKNPANKWRRPSFEGNVNI